MHFDIRHWFPAITVLVLEIDSSDSFQGQHFYTTNKQEDTRVQRLY